MSFKLPGLNVSSKDVESFEAKHVPAADKVDVTGEVDERVAAALRREEEEKRRQAGRLQVSSRGVANPKEDGLCFPEHAEVQTPQGLVTMSELRVGDTIRAIDDNGHAFWDEVYFFGHADGASIGKFLQIELVGLDTPVLQLSLKHFVPGCLGGVRCTWGERMHAYAQDLQKGDYIWIARSGELQLEQLQIQKISSITAKGLYNPYTLSGTIVVNGVVASSHSDWILDDLVPTSWLQWLPAIYQALFFPGRVLYHILRTLGPEALETVVSLLDLSNPQAAPERSAISTKCAIQICQR